MTPPDLPLRGRRVLITRAREDAARLTGLLESMGAEVMSLPSIAVEPPEDWRPLDTALQRLIHYDWIVFTSRNAVRAVFDRMPALGLSQWIPDGITIAAVGPSTVAQLASYGAVAHLVADEATAGSLASLMIEAGVEGARVLLPAGNLARLDLRRTLEVAGAEVDQVTVYRTEQPVMEDPAALEALRREEIDAVALASPSAVRNLVEMLGADWELLRQVQVACIGPTTAEAVRELGLQPAAVASEQTAAGLVQAVAGIFTAERNHG